MGSPAPTDEGGIGRGPRDTHGQTIRHANPGALNLTAHQAATERRVSETLGLIAANVRNQIVS